ncbi:MAG TPA: FG-GAP-like repeat-containing protein [Opitutaceae bacterium]|nr:FG-GAP-like repeat-containing protein [Opitutaceae bacterium]
MSFPPLPRAVRRASAKAWSALPKLLAAALAAGVLHAAPPSGPGLVATPLNPPSGPAGATMFTLMPPARTGIGTTNRYDDPRMWGKRNYEFEVGAIGTGVAIGDYDGDGLPDLFIVSKVESGRLFRNLGNFHFQDVTKEAGLEDDSGAWKQGTTFVDVNNDGRLDLYVCRFRAPNQLFINQGDGTFKEEAAARGLAVVDACGMASFCDYDRDGWPDVFIQTNLKDFRASPTGQRDYLFHNNGNGTFTDVTDAAGILRQPAQGHSAIWWDYDEDGWPDLYVANDFDPSDVLYHNNHDGTFTDVINRVVPHQPFSSMGSDVADVDNDGHLDLFATDMRGTTPQLVQRGLAALQYEVDPGLNDETGTAIQIRANALYLNTGVGRCLEAAGLAGLSGTDWTWSPRFEDLDNDGRVDLFVTNGMDRDQIDLDLVNRRLAALSPAERVRIMRDSPVLRQANLAYRNLGHLRFENVGRKWGLDEVGVSFGTAFGDLDGDGDLDVVYTNYEKGATVLRNDSQTGHRVIIALRGTTSNRFGLGCRVEATSKSGLQVRVLTAARGYLSSSEPVVHFGLGDDPTIERLRIVWPSGRVQTFTNLPAGYRYTITEPSAAAAVASPPPARPATLFQEISGSGGIRITQREEKLEGTVTQPLLPRRFNHRGPGVAVGDLDGDGVDEIVVGATSLDGVKILHHQPTGYHPVDPGAVGRPPSIDDGPPLLFDANGDGFNDLLCTGGGAALPAEDPAYEPRLWLNDGRGAFHPAPAGMMPSEPISVGAAVAADFNRDGKLDLFLGGRLLPGDYPEAATSALLFRQGGRFVDVTDSVAPGLRNVGLVTSALATDVDGDGWVDLVVTLEWGGVRFFRNQQGHGFTDASGEWGFDRAGTGLWTSLAAGDFNHDGRLDYVVGNLGLNTPYTASRAHPLRLFVGDFAGSGTPQLVEALDDNGALLPLASRDELASRIPAVRRRFPSNDRYAAATLDQILGRDALSKADVYQAGELQSGILLSQPSGHYQFVPLPRYAQIAPIQGMVAGDFDGDGNCDVLLVANDYSPITARGRFDGGLGWLLRGDGRGGFEPMPIARSGWVVPGNAKGLAVADLDHDGRPDAVVTRNNDSMLLFRNAGTPATRPIAIRLHGRAGNPDAIGARITLEEGTRVLQLTEIEAGGGLGSESTPTAFFSLPPGLGPAAHFTIRWPSGATRAVPIPAHAGYLDLRE